MYANGKGYGETARMRRLALAFAARRYDKYQILICCLILVLYSVVYHIFDKLLQLPNISFTGIALI